MIALGDDGLLAPLGGEELAEGVYLFPNEAALESLLVRRGQARVRMREVLEGTTSLAEWSRGLQKALERTKEDHELKRSLLDLSTPVPWSEFIKVANTSLREQPQARFIEQLKASAQIQYGHGFENAPAGLPAQS